MTDPLPTPPPAARSNDMEPAPALDQPALSYAAAPPITRRRIRRILIGALVVIVIGLLIGWRKPLVTAARLHYWQRACARYSLNPGTLVAASSAPGKLLAPPMPACWANYSRLSGSPLGRAPSSFPETIVFLHQLQRPDGQSRIVVIRCYPLYLPSASIIQSLQPMVIEPAASWPINSRPIFHGGHLAGGYPGGDNVQLFAGQIDSADPTHFTLPYTRNGQPDTIDAYLDNDNTVTFQLRSRKTPSNNLK